MNKFAIHITDKPITTAFGSSFSMNETSLDTELPDVTKHIKENKNDNYNNSEIEKGEVLLKNDMSSILKASGKTHAKGGIKVNLDDGDFIYSNYSKLAISPKEHKLYELKEGGSFAKGKNTPAEVLKRNIDTEDYNKMVALLQDDKKGDLISKKSAALMINKYQEVLGKLAYIQETKKNEQAPSFSNNTAPVYDNNLKKEIKQQPQYMKKGGFLQQYLEGDEYNPLDVKPLKSKDKRYGSKELFNPYLNKLNFLANPSSIYGFPTSSPITNVSQYQDYISNNYGDLVYDAFENNSDYFGLTNKAYDPSLRSKYNIAPNIKGDYKSLTDVQKQIIADEVNKLDASKKYSFIQDQFKDKLQGQRFIDLNQKTFNTQEELDAAKKGLREVKTKDGRSFYVNPYDKSNPDVSKVYNYFTLKPKEKETIPLKKDAVADTKTEVPPINSPQDLSLNGKRQGINWQFTPWQQANLGWAALQAAKVERQFPYRPQVKSQLVDLQKLNPQQALNQSNNAVSLALKASQSMNPYLGGASSQNAIAQGMNQSASILGQYDEKNSQIANQQELANNQILNRDLQQNIAFDKEYYDATQDSYRNYRNMKDVANNSFINQANQYASTNQALAYNIASLGPNAPYKYNFKTGQFELTGQNPMNVVSKAFSNDPNYAPLLKKIQELSQQPVTKENTAMIAALSKSLASIDKFYDNKKMGGFINKSKYRTIK